VAVALNKKIVNTFEDLEPHLKNLPPDAKILVLDRSALITEHRPWSVFENSYFIVPLIIIESLGKIQDRGINLGSAARLALKTLDKITAEGGDPRIFPLPRGNFLAIAKNGVAVQLLRQEGLDEGSTSNRVLGVCLGLQQYYPNTTLVASDSALRLKARQFKLQTSDITNYEPIEAHGPGWGTIKVAKSTVNELYRTKKISKEDEVCGEGVVNDIKNIIDNFPPENQFIVLDAPATVSGESKSSVTLQRKGKELLLLPSDKGSLKRSLMPKTNEQRLALSLLRDPDVQIVGLAGPAGTGKTLLAVGAALEQIIDRDRALYEELIVVRPTVPLDSYDIGFLPGSLDEKLAVWADPIFDNLAALSIPPDAIREKLSYKEYLLKKELLTLGSIAHLRGRSFIKRFIIVDEAQNCDTHVLKLLLTRVGEGSKIVFTGDTDQIDSAYLSKTNNALTALIETFRGKPYFGYIGLAKGVRSLVATAASELL
jgi:PhoH-like ATPase